MRWALLAVVFPQHFILLNKILILGVSVSAVSAPTPGVHSILWCYCEQRSGRASMLCRESVGSLMMSHLYLNSSWSELLALLASSGECVLLAPTTCLLVCEVLPSSMCLGLIPGPVLTALVHRSWATSYIALHTLWALAAFSLQSWFQNQLQVRPLGPSLPAGSDMSSIMVLSTLPQCHAWERDHKTLYNIRTVTFECVLGLMTTSSYRPGNEREQHKHELGEHLFHCEPSMFRSENMWNGQRRLNDQL